MTPGLAVGVLDGSLPQILFVPQKFGYSVEWPQTAHLSFSPFGPQIELAQETFFPAEEAQKLHKRERKIGIDYGTE